MHLADGSAVRPGYLLTDGSVEPDAIPSRRPGARDDGLEGQRAARPRKTRITGIYPNDTWSGPHVTWSREHCRAAHSLCRSRETRSCCPTATPCRRPPAPASTSSPTRRPSLRVPLSPAGGTCTVVFNIAPTAVPSEVIPGSKDDRELGAHFNAFAYRRRENRLRRQPAVASGDGSRQLHARHARRHASRRPRGARARRVRADEPARPGAHPGRARRARRRAAHVAAPASHAIRTAWSIAGHPPRSASSAPSTCSTSPTGCTRRSEQGSARRRSTISCPSTIPSGRPADAVHARPQVRRRRHDLRRHLRQLGLHGRETTETLGVAAGADPHRAAAPSTCSARTAPPPSSARRTSSRWPRSSRGRTYRCSPRRTGCSAATSARGRRSRGLGRAAAPRRPAAFAGSATCRTTSSRGSIAEPRSSPTPRVSRASAFRSSRRWPVAPPWSPPRTSRSTRRVGRRALRADPEDPAAFAAAIERAVADRERLVALGLEHVRRFSWRSVGETFLRGYEEAAR